VTVDLPSVGCNPPVTTHLGVTAIVRKLLERSIVSECKDVVLIMHSYGGVAGGGAVSRLEKTARQEAGMEEGVIACVFLAAFLVSKGWGLLGMFDNQFPPYLAVDPQDEKSLVIIHPTEAFYNDVPADISTPWITSMRPQSYASFQAPVELVCWESGLVPCTYVMCDSDSGVYPPLQESMVKEVSEDGRPWIKSSYSVWLSQPKAVVEAGPQAASEEVSAARWVMIQSLG